MVLFSLFIVHFNELNILTAASNELKKQTRKSSISTNQLQYMLPPDTQIRQALETVLKTKTKVCVSAFTMAVHARQFQSFYV